MDDMDNNALRDRVAELEKQLMFYRDYDYRTELYNKEAFCQKAEEVLHLFPEKKFQIIYIDIERFKLINDFYGTEKGNDLLHYVAACLKKRFVGENCFCTRFGADTFVVFRQTESVMEDKKAVEDIQAIFRKYPIDMDIHAAIGFYEIEDTEVSVNLMCDRAGLAAASVKGNYAVHSAWYSNKMRNLIVEEHELLNGLESALESGEFEVYIQPKCNMRTGKVTGGEALVRWHHPIKGMIPPKDFIPIFEKNGFIKRLDMYVWEETARLLHKRDVSGNPMVPVSVNVSRIDIFGMDIDLFFRELVEKYHLDTKWLELEITESAYISQTNEVIAVVDDLMANGFTLLMDDFGSGYSALNLLKDINIDVLKLDMRFLDSTQKKSKSILESVVRMARWMDLKVIAEGVEKKEQIDFLLGIGCTYAQGFYYYRPMPAAEFEELLKVPDAVDFNDGYMVEENASTVIHMRDFFAEDLLSEVLLGNILGIVVLYSYDGKTLRVTRGNMKYHQILHPEVPLGKDVSKDALNMIHEEDRYLFLHALEQAHDAGNDGISITVRRSLYGGRMAWMQVRLFFLSEANGRSLYYAALSDVSDYMDLVEQARISEERFRLASESSQDTIFDVDIPARTARYTVRSKELFGFEDSYTDAPEGFIRQGSVQPEFEEEFREMYRAIYRGEDSATCTIRASLGDGSVVWNRITLTAIRDNMGKSVKAVGLVRNVTREKELEIELEKKENE